LGTYSYIPPFYRLFSHFLSSFFPQTLYNYIVRGSFAIANHPTFATFILLGVAQKSISRRLIVRHECIAGLKLVATAPLTSFSDTSYYTIILFFVDSTSLYPLRPSLPKYYSWHITWALHAHAAEGPHKPASMSASYIVRDVGSSLTLVQDVSDLDYSQAPLRDMSDTLMSNAKYYTNDGSILSHGGVNPFSSLTGDGYLIHDWLKALIADVDLIGHAFLAIEEPSDPPPTKSKFLPGFQALSQALAHTSAVYAGVKRLQWDEELCSSAWKSQDSLGELFHLLPNNQRFQISGNLRGHIEKQTVRNWALEDNPIGHLQAELANHAQVIMARLRETGPCACRSGRVSTAANETCCRGVQESIGSVNAGLSFTRQSAVVADPRANGGADNGSLSIYTVPSLTTETTAKYLSLSNTNDAKERPAHDLDSQYSEYENDRDTDCPKSEITYAPSRDSRPDASHASDPRDPYLQHLGPELQVPGSTASTRPEAEIANVLSFDEFPQLASLINSAGRSCSWQPCAGCNQGTHTTAYGLETQTAGLSYAIDRWFKSHEEPWNCLRMPTRGFLRDILHGTSSSRKVEPQLGNVRLYNRVTTASHNELDPSPRSPTPPKDCSLAHLFANLNLQGDGNREHLAIGILDLANGSEETSKPPVGSHESSKKSKDMPGKRKSQGRNRTNRGSGSCGEDDPRRPPRKQRKRRIHPPYFAGYLKCLYRDMPTHGTCSMAFRYIYPLKRVSRFQHSVVAHHYHY
jgi:hypothetical protein